MDKEGHLVPRFKIRTKRKVIKAIVDKMEEYAQGGLEYSGKCYISHSYCYEDAKEVARLIEERFPKLNGKVEINRHDHRKSYGPRNRCAVFLGERQKLGGSGLILLKGIPYHLPLDSIPLAEILFTFHPSYG